MAPSSDPHPGSDRAERLRHIQSGAARGVLPTCVRGVLQVACLGFAAGRGLHRFAYASGLLRRVRLPRPVVSVGNLTAGGAGKTPLVAWLCQQAKARGREPVVLARGYGRREGEAWNDEGLWLRQVVPGLVVLQDPDRAAAARAYLRTAPVDVFLLDDGFQHERLHRDLDVVLVDGLRPFGFGHRLPRGLLRDPPSALARADVVLLTRAEVLSRERREELVVRLRSLAPAALHGVVALPVRQVEREGRVEAAEVLRGRRVYLMCGVGNPEAVRRTLTGLGAEVVGSFPARDHHDYSPSDRDAALDACRRAQAELVITAKDQVKLQRLPGGAGPAWVLRQEVQFEAGEEELCRRLEELCGRQDA